jgi:hypothetical protein
LAKAANSGGRFSAGVAAADVVTDMPSGRRMGCGGSGGTDEAGDWGRVVFAAGTDSGARLRASNPSKQTPASRAMRGLRFMASVALENA